MDIDFEGTGVTTNSGGATEQNAATEQDKDNLNGQKEVVDINKDNTDNQNGDNSNEGGGDNSNSNTNADNSQTSSTGGLEQGTEVEFDGEVYTVAENGDLVDKEGKVFKEAKDVDNWLKENGFTDTTESNNNNEFSIDSIKSAIGVDVTDENGKPIEFTNDAAGIKGYVQSVLDLKSKELQTGAINNLFNEVPILKEFIDYLQVNNGNPRGFGEIPDRSGIKLDENNEAQLEAVIRTAAMEFGNKSLNDNYIKYLKSSGSLYEEAKTQLAALVAKDKQYRADLETRAQAARDADEQRVKQYWQGVSDAITKRVINGYKLPESIVKEVNGQKLTLTPTDFYNYLSRATETDEEGNPLTGYQRDLNKLSDEELMNKELLDAWLMFTGGSYKDLIDMKIEEEKVRRLVVKSKEQRTSRTIKVNKPQSSKINHNDIVFD